MLMNELWKNVNENHTEFLCYLWERWQDEKEYEDIQDYLTAIQARIPEAYKMTKRPFGVHCKCDDGSIHIQIKRSGNYLKVFGKMNKANAC